MEIVADCREQAVIPYLHLLNSNLSIVAKQINTGDYLIRNGDSVCMCIERKTYTDLEASFRDGRYQNFGKMIQFRTDNKECQLYSILEAGGKPQNPDAIKMAVYALMVRDNIHVIKTKTRISGMTKPVQYHACDNNT